MSTVHTILYNSESDVDYALTLLCKESLAVPIVGSITDEQLKLLMPTPLLITIGDLLTDDNIKFALSHGFMHVKIFGKDVSLESVMTEDHDPRIEYVSTKDFIEQLPIKPILASYKLCDLLLRIKYNEDQYSSAMSTSQEAKNFETGAKNKYGNIPSAVAEMLSTWKTFEIMDKLITFGEAFTEVEKSIFKQMAKQRVNSMGKTVTWRHAKGYVVYSYDLVNEVKDMIKSFININQELIKTKNEVKQMAVDDVTGMIKVESDAEIDSAVNYKFGVYYYNIDAKIEDKLLNGYYIEIFFDKDVNMMKTIKKILGENEGYKVLANNEGEIKLWCTRKNTRRLLPFI